MKILVLDDNELIIRAPESYFENPHDYREDDIVQVAGCDAFWFQHKLGGWDEVWLDHDLGNPMEDGRTVTKQIAELSHMGVRFSETFVVISMNPVAAQTMVSDLATGGHNKMAYAPISSLGSYGVSRGNHIYDRSAVLRPNHKES